LSAVGVDEWWRQWEKRQTKGATHQQKKEHDHYVSVGGGGSKYRVD
jgi:hypothetical protein